jgi:hypothetical protein
MKPINLREWEVRAISDGATIIVRPIDRIASHGRVKQFQASTTPGYDWQFRCRRGLWQDYRNAELMPKLGFGGPGEILWGRETWVECLHTSPATDQPELCDGDKLIEHATQYVGADGEKRWHYNGRVICYRATSDVEFCDGDGFTGDMANRNDLPRWRPSTQMPLWASRFHLLNKAVRCLRVQELSEADAIKAGHFGYHTPRYNRLGDLQQDTVLPSETMQQQFIEDHGPDAWDRNDWVAVCEFKQETA